MASSPTKIQSFSTGALPDIVPFPSAIRAGEWVYVSGQLGNVPGKMQLVAGGFEAEARQALDHLRDALLAAGSSLDRVAKCTVYFTDMKDFSRFNEIYRGYFKSHLPARSGVEVQALALGARIEIDCVALAS